MQISPIAAYTSRSVPVESLLPRGGGDDFFRPFGEIRLLLDIRIPEVHRRPVIQL